jgi:hypothetical protein
MPWNVEYDSELNLVLCTFVGRVSAAEYIEAKTKAFLLAQEKGTNRYLVDDTDWETAISVTDMYEWPKLYEQWRADRLSRVAVIMPNPDSPEARDLQFYETTSRNRGWNVSVFPTRDEAVAWLLEPENAAE